MKPFRTGLSYPSHSIDFGHHKKNTTCQATDCRGRPDDACLRCAFYRNGNRGTSPGTSLCNKTIHVIQVEHCPDTLDMTECLDGATSLLLLNAYCVYMGGTLTHNQELMACTPPQSMLFILSFARIFCGRTLEDMRIGSTNLGT